MKRLRYLIRAWAGFTEAEASGFILIIILILIFLLSPLLVKYFLPEPNFSFIDADRRKLDSLLAIFKAAETEENLVIASRNQKAVAKLFSFDPNTATKSDLLLLGFSEGIANSLIKYRLKGGVFRKKDDLAKIYNLPPALFNRLRDSIALPDSLTRLYKSDSTRLRTYAKPAPFEINTADTNQLIALKGIGPFIAKIIIARRNDLGGYTNLNQLHEIGYLDSVEIAEVKKFASINIAQVKKLNLNAATEAELQRHPYMPRRLARTIVNYRTQHGPFESEEQLLQIKSLKTADFLRLKPYLSVGD